MLSILQAALDFVILLLKLYFTYVLVYAFYYRVIDYFRSRRFYESQEGVAVCEGAVPVFGNLMTCIRAYKKAQEMGDNSFMLKQFLDLSINYY